MKDLREASFALGINILWDMTNYVLQLSQKAYIDRVLKRFDMYTCSLGNVPVTKGDKLSKDQWLKNKR